LAFTSADVTALERAIAKGTLQVTLGDRTIRYQSMADLIRARDLAKSEVAEAAAGSTKAQRLRRYQVFSRG